MLGGGGIGVGGGGNVGRAVARKLDGQSHSHLYWKARFFGAIDGKGCHVAGRYVDNEADA